MLFRSTLFQKSVFSKVSVLGRWVVFRSVPVFEKSPYAIPGLRKGVGADYGRLERGNFSEITFTFRSVKSPLLVRK